MENASDLLYLGTWWLNQVAQPIAIITGVVLWIRDRRRR